MPRVLLIDLDETLVDRSAVMVQWAQETAEAHGDPSLQSWLVAFDRDGDGVRNRPEFLAGVTARLGWSESIDVLISRWPATFGARYQLSDDVRFALQRARESGCRLAMVSNGASDRQRAKVEAMRLGRFVDAVLISEEVGVRKPDPKIFAMAAETVGASLDDAWMIGDDPVADIGGGWSAGARPIWVNRTNKPWPEDLQRAFWECADPVTAIDFASTYR